MEPFGLSGIANSDPTMADAWWHLNSFELRGGSIPPLANKVFGVIPNICRMLVDGNGLAIASNLARLGKSRAGGSSCNGQIASMPKGNDALFVWSEIQSAKGRA